VACRDRAHLSGRWGSVGRSCDPSHPGRPPRSRPPSWTSGERPGPPCEDDGRSGLHGLDRLRSPLRRGAPEHRCADPRTDPRPCARDLDASASGLVGAVCAWALAVVRGSRRRRRRSCLRGVHRHGLLLPAGLRGSGEPHERGRCDRLLPDRVRSGDASRGSDHGARRPTPPRCACRCIGGRPLRRFGYAHRSRIDIRNWDRAATLQKQELARLSSSGGRPAPGTTIFAVGGTGEVAPNVSAFSVTWDLDTALELRWNDPTLHAYPVFSGTTFVCTASTVTPTGFWNSAGTPPPTVAYGHALFFDLRGGRRKLVRNQQDCVRAQREFRPGPII
jgi:hypothetical protein